MPFCPVCALLFAVVALAAYFLFKKFCKCPYAEPKIRKTDWVEDTVYLYQFNRPPKMANLSAYCVKLEMFLRIHGINYVNCFISHARSKYGLVPFVELNGVHYADSQLIEEKLKENFKIKPLDDPREEAFARCLDRLVESHTFALIYKYKALDNVVPFVETVLPTLDIPNFAMPLAIPVAKFMLKRKAINKIHTILGPFTDQEFHMLLNKDLDAIRDALGKNKFLMGDEPTSVDCTVFGHLATVCYLELDTVVKALVRDEYPTVQEYLDRVVEKVFPAEFA